jgi:hypothetical protein
MTNTAKTAREAIQSLAVADLDEISDAELREEIVADGKDPDTLARDIAEHLDEIASHFMRDRVAATKAVRKATDVPASVARPSLTRIKELIQRAFDAEPNLAAAFRDGKKQTDNDVMTLFDDLVALGKIDPASND